MWTGMQDSRNEIDIIVYDFEQHLKFISILYMYLMIISAIVINKVIWGYLSENKKTRDICYQMHNIF